MVRRLSALVLPIFFVVSPALSEPPTPGEILKIISRVDPETDPILGAIRTAVAPTEEQGAAILDLYRALREEQQRAFFEVMGEWSGEGAMEGDPVMPAIVERVERASGRFMTEVRALLTIEQEPRWDACVDDLQLQPLGNFAAGEGGNVDPAKEGPKVGDPAPPFELVDLEGRVVTLESLRGKPVVIEFGSLSCPMFRGKVYPFREVVRRFGDRVHFLVIYTREAHPAGTPRAAAINPAVGIEIADHGSFAERLSSAARTADQLALERTLLIDDLDDAVTEAYGGHPNWGFVLDAEGRVVARQVWSDPGQVDRVLRKLLGEGAGEPR